MARVVCSTLTAVDCDYHIGCILRTRVSAHVIYIGLDKSIQPLLLPPNALNGRGGRSKTDLGYCVQQYRSGSPYQHRAYVAGMDSGNHSRLLYHSQVLVVSEILRHPVGVV